MVLALTCLNVADNAGAYEVKCIKILGNKFYKAAILVIY